MSPRHHAPARPRVVALVPALGDKRGVERHNRTMCKAMTEWLTPRGGRLDVVSLRDPAGWWDPRYVDRPVVGCGDNRYRFAARAFSALARPYDLLVLGNVDFGVLTLIPAALRRTAPILTVVYGIEVWRDIPWTFRRSLDRAERILSISAFTRDVVVARHAVDPARTTVVPIPLPPLFSEESDEAANISRPETCDLLTIAGMNRIDADKGIDTVIASMGDLVPTDPALRLVVVGDGNDRPRLEALAHDRGVADHVQFAGRVPDERVHRLLAGAKIFVMPSRKEGFGIVFLEAMQYGLPVVAGRHGGAPEVVVDGVTGILVTHGDVPALTAALGLLLGDPERRRALGEAGRRRVHDEFSYTAFRTRIGELMDELVGGHAAAATAD